MTLDKIAEERSLSYTVCLQLRCEAELGLVGA
jgi:ribosomal protein L40E